MDDAPKTPAEGGGSEPSMEEILASIRKIIADENEPAAANGAAPAGDVLELTQMVQEDGSVVDLKPEEPPPAPAEEKPMPPPPPPPPPPEEKKAAPPVAKKEAPAGEIVSDPAASAAASALSSLASTVELERMASVPPPTSTYMGNSARTLEDMTMELMKPLLKEWLDKNLPAVVDRLVQKEIERISKKAQE